MRTQVGHVGSRQMRLAIVRFATTLGVVLCAGRGYAAIDASQHFLIESSGPTGYTQLSSPSVNGLGDVAYRGTDSGNTPARRRGNLATWYV
jgi:hypothetical protein